MLLLKIDCNFSPILEYWCIELNVNVVEVKQNRKPKQAKNIT